MQRLVDSGQMCDVRKILCVLTAGWLTLLLTNLEISAQSCAEITYLVYESGRNRNYEKYSILEIKLINFMKVIQHSFEHGLEVIANTMFVVTPTRIL